MPVQVSYKKQFALMLMLLVTMLVIVEVMANIWLYYFYRCSFEDNEIFKNLDSETKRKICIESLEYGFINTKLTRVQGAFPKSLDENLVHINSDGFRGPEFTKDKPENTYRIFTLGGSTTFGSGVFDNQTYPNYLQEMFDQSNLGFKTEVINLGWPASWSLEETKMIKNQFLDYEPDLFIVYDGINELGHESKDFETASAAQWKERWAETCDLGKKYGFDVLVTIQPSVNTGEKILTKPEHAAKIKQEKSNPYPDHYHLYIEKLESLKDHCSVTADLTGIFDHERDTIYFDAFHVGPKGNQIIAKNMYQISLPLVLEGAKRVDSIDVHNVTSLEDINSSLISNDFDIFMEQTYQNSRNIFSSYKTPKVFSLIFSNL